MSMQITITRPDDWHLHVRDGDFLRDVVPHTARQFGRAIIMPNLRPPVTTTEQAAAYRRRVLDAVPEGVAFEPLMTLYLTDRLAPSEIVAARESGFVHAVKLYPAGATTNSESGVTDLSNCYETLAEMEKSGMPLLVHGEVTSSDIDIFDREAVFIERHLVPVVQRFPGLKIVLEHITTADGIAFVQESGNQVAGTLTVHHLMYNRNKMLAGGIRPHYYCLPVLKRETHRQALLAAATGGSPKFFLGTDSAPHVKGAKESACGCAGSYTAYAAMELYASVFEQADALDKLESFASLNGPAFYGLPVNKDKITLVKQSWTVPAEYPLGESTVVPLTAGEQLEWKLV